MRLLTRLPSRGEIGATGWKPSKVRYKFFPPWFCLTVKCALKFPAGFPFFPRLFSAAPPIFEAFHFLRRYSQMRRRCWPSNKTNAQAKWVEDRQPLDNRPVGRRSSRDKLLDIFDRSLNLPFPSANVLSWASSFTNARPVSPMELTGRASFLRVNERPRRKGGDWTRIKKSIRMRPAAGLD